MTLLPSPLSVSSPLPCCGHRQVNTLCPPPSLSLCGINQLLAYLVSSAALLRNTSVYLSALTGSSSNLFSLPALLPGYELDYMAAVAAALLTLLVCMSTRAFDNSNKGRRAVLDKPYILLRKSCTGCCQQPLQDLRSKMLSCAAAALMLSACPAPAAQPPNDAAHADGDRF